MSIEDEESRTKNRGSRIENEKVEYGEGDTCGRHRFDWIRKRGGYGLECGRVRRCRTHNGGTKEKGNEFENNGRTKITTN